VQQGLPQSQRTVKGAAVLEANCQVLLQIQRAVKGATVQEANSRIHQMQALAKETSSQARGSRAAEKSDNSSEDDNETHRRGVKNVIADFEMVGEAYRQGFIHYYKPHWRDSRAHGADGNRAGCTWLRA